MRNRDRILVHPCVLSILNEYDQIFKGWKKREKMRNRDRKSENITHIVKEIKPNPKFPITCALDLDFATGHLCIVFLQKINGKMLIFDEINCKIPPEAMIGYRYSENITHKNVNF